MKRTIFTLFITLLFLSINSCQWQEKQTIRSISPQGQAIAVALQTSYGFGSFLTLKNNAMNEYKAVIDKNVSIKAVKRSLPAKVWRFIKSDYKWIFAATVVVFAVLVGILGVYLPIKKLKRKKLKVDQDWQNFEE